LLFTIDNMNRKEYWFLIKSFTGTPELGGEEKERMIDENQYMSIWS